MSPNGLWIATVNTSSDVSLWDSAKVRLLAQIPAAEPLFRIAFLDNEHVVAAGQNGYLEVIDVAGSQRSAPQVIRLIGDSPRWRVENGRVVERQ